MSSLIRKQVAWLSFLSSSKFTILSVFICVTGTTYYVLNSMPQLVADNGADVSKASGGYSMAFHDSFGFFNDISDHDWLLRKASMQGRLHHLKPKKVQRVEFGGSRRPASFYQTNWDPNFSCPLVEPVGGIRDGHKWVCDPHRLVQKKDCLVYSIGSNNHFDFEDGLQKFAPHCEIHIFDPADYSSSITETSRRNLNMTFHPWGLKGSYPVNETETSDSFTKKFGNEGDFKSLQETAELLGHEGRVVDLFKIDCEGCEWRSYKDWLYSGVLDLRQVLVEVHNAPPVVVDFFQDFYNEGYAIFSKEPNLGGASLGNCVEFSFLKLAKEFFESER